MKTLVKLTKSFDDLLKDKVNNSKKNNRKHSNQKFYMLYLAYKIMKKIHLNPDITERELKLVNSNFSRILLSILESVSLIVPRYSINNKNYVYGLTAEGRVYVDFIDRFLVLLGYNEYNEKDFTKEEDELNSLFA